MKKIFLLCLLCILKFNTANAQPEAEPNDAWDASNLSTIGTPGNGVAIAGDHDWWQITTPSDGDLTITWTAPISYVYCQIYDSLGVINLYTDYTNGTKVGTVAGLAKGTYYFRFYNYYNTETNSYSFTPTFTPASVPNDPEPNSTASTGTVFALNTTVTGHINYYFNNEKDTLDWYKITTTQGGKLSWTITSENGKYVWAELFDGDMTTFISGNYTSTTATYNADGLAPGTYYLRLKSFYVTLEYSPYTLTNVFTPPTYPVDPEPNNTPATASVFPINATVTGQVGYKYNGAKDSVDWWQVNITDDGRLDFTITSGNGQNTYAELFDGDGITELAGNYTSSTASYFKDGLAPGIYYIGVRNFYNYEFTSYSLSNTFTIPTQSPEAVGYNNLYTSPTIFAINSSTTGHIGYRYNQDSDTSDYFKVTVPASGLLTWTITSHNGANVYAELMDGNGTTELAGNYTTSTATYSKDGLATGDYYILIRTFYDYEFAPYTLSNSFTPSPLANDSENNNTALIGVVLPMNSSVTGQIGYQYNSVRDSADYYKVVLPVDGKFTWSITSQNGQNIYAELFDNNGTTELGGNYTTSTATFTENNLGAGTYYILVRTYYESEYSSYTLSSTLEPMNFLVEDTANNALAARGTVLPANTPTTGHYNFYYNLVSDAVDWWKIGYDGSGPLSLQIELEQNHFNGSYPFLNYALFEDTTASAILSGQVNVASSTFNLTGLAVKTYYLRLTYVSGYFGAYRLTTTYVENCANVVAVNSSEQVAGCNGTITYGISDGLAPYTVQLYRDGSPFGIAETTNSTISFSNLPLGTYYARSYSFGASGICNNISADVTFIAPEVPTVSAGTSTTFCQGESVTLTSSPAASYLWSSGETTQSIVVSTAGNYSVTAYNAAGCESQVSGATTVVVNPLPATPIISSSGATTFCEGGSVGLNSTTEASYLWSTGATTQGITTTTSGTFSVTVTDANGCSASSAGVSVTVNSLPATPVISANNTTTFCQGGSVTLSSTAEANYLWSNGSTTQSTTISTTGNYSVTVTDLNGCSSASLPSSVTVNPLPTVTLAPFSSVCNTNSAFTLTGGSPAGGTYSGTGVSGGMFDPTAAGVGTFTITYSYTDGNTCSNTASSTIQVTNCAGCSASITPGGPTTFCDGGSVVLNSSAGVSYLWNTGATSQSITATSSGTYSVAVTDANNCTATASVVVTETSPVIASSSSTAIVCSGGSATVTVSATGGTAPYTGTGTFTRTAGTYSFTVTDVNNCSASTTITITEPTALTASSSATPILCNGGSSTVTVSATGGTAPYSGTGAFTRAAGTWSFTVTDANGCSTSTSVTITQPSALTISTSPGGAILCFGGTTPVNVSATGGTAPYTGTGSFNQAAGTTLYSVTDANGCTSSSSVTLTQPSKVEGVTSSTAASGCSVSDGTASVVVSGGTGSYTYLWSTSQTLSTATGLIAGTYSVTFTDANGCTGSATVTVSGLGGSIGTPGSIVGSQGACRNTSGIVYSVSPVPGATSYTWTLPAGATGSSTTNSITVAFTNAFNGGFICVAANNACGTSMSSCQNIPVITTYPSQPAVISGPEVACGPGVYTYSTSSANALSYNWVVTGAGLSITSGIGTNTIQLTVAAGFKQGSLQVRGVNCNGSSAVRGMTITGIPAHSNAVSGPSFVCANGSATYSMPVVNGVTTYTWSITGGATLGSQITNASTTSATFDFGPSWTGGTVTILTSNSCGTFSRTFAVRSTPAQPGGITGPGTAVCGATNVTYSIAAVAGATSYSWTVPAGVSVVSTAPSGLSIVVNFTGAFTGTGNICVKANNSCGQGPARCFAITARPAVPVISGPASVCKTQSSVVYNISPVSGATSYSWSATGGASISPSGNTASVNYNTALSSSVVIRANANNACGSSQPGALGVSVNLFCRTASENVDENSTSFEVYPNPVSTKATITFNSETDQKYLITLTDMIGNIVYSDTISATKEFNSMEINVADFSRGIYLINVTSESGNTLIEKIIVE